MDMSLEAERGEASPYDALAADPKFLAVLATVRRVVGLPTDPARTTFAPAQAVGPRPLATAAPERQGERPGAALPPGELPPKRPARRTVPVASSLGPGARRSAGPAGRPAPPDLRAGPPRSLLFGGIAALLLHLAVFLAVGGAEPVLKADAGPVGTIIGALIERAGLPT